MKKTAYHHGNLKEEFLEIAFDFIKTESVENLTLKVLSDATGTSRSAIYRHFDSKDALIEKMIVDGLKIFDEVIASALQDEKRSLLDRFYLASKNYVEFAKNNANLYRLLFGKKYSHIREELVSIQDEDCSGFAVLKTTVEEGQASGIFKKDDSYKQTIIIWAAMHGLSLIIIDGFLDTNSDDISDELTNNMFSSIFAGLVTKKVKIASILPFADKLLTPTDM